MEASTLSHAGSAGFRGTTPLLRLASDERLVALTRRGNQAAYETLVSRYHARLLAFCRHMVSSREDAEDVLQEVFAAAYGAMVADERPINVRPWLYRIARNRSLNHLRRQQPIGTDSMDIHVADQGTTTADKVHKREDFRQLMADVKTLPETQRTALLLREIDALHYDQIAEAMDTTIPAVKSLLVRARLSLAEAAEARALSCSDVRIELGEVAEGIGQRLSAPARRHVRTCESCGGFRKQLRVTNKALAAAFPVAPLLFFKKAALAHLGTTASAGGATATTAAIAAGTGAGSASVLSAGIGAVASKTAAGLAAAAIVTAGAVEVKHAQQPDTRRAPVAAAVAAPGGTELVVLDQQAQPTLPPSTGGAQAPDGLRSATADDAAATAVTIEQGSDSATLPPASPLAGGATAPVPTPAGATPVQTGPTVEAFGSGGVAAPDPATQPVVGPGAAADPVVTPSDPAAPVPGDEAPADPAPAPSDPAAPGDEAPVPTDELPVVDDGTAQPTTPVGDDALVPAAT